MKKRIICIILSVMTVLTASLPAGFTAFADTYEEQLKKAGFPSSYIPQLVALHEKYPNWKFQALATNVDFSTAVAQERTPHSQQLIQKYSGNNNKGYYCGCSSCYKNGAYVIQEGGSWVSASLSAVEYYMNPGNFLDEKYIFQFESTSYDSAQTKDGVETIISKTWMANSKIYYLDANGVNHLYNNSNYKDGITYSQAIMEAAKNSGLSAYYLASKIVQEVGGKTNSATGASGTNSTYPGIYNYYNIGAYSGGLDGLKWAATSTTTSAGTTYKTNTNAYMRSGPSTSSSKVLNNSVPKGTTLTYISATDKQSDGYVWYNVSAKISGTTYTGYIRSDLVTVTTSSGTTDKYKRPWTNPFVSIYQGAKYIATNFSSTQNTGYLQKFNVSPASTNRYNHEYMANVQAAVSESLTSYNAYKTAGLLSSAKTFIIPIYKNLPDEDPYTWKLGSDGYWYLYDQSGTKQTGWRYVGDKWYYMNSDGKMQVGWRYINGKWYYLSSSGAMLTGLQKINGKYYYLDSKGAMATGWVQLNGTWYYFNADGDAAIGFKTVSGKTYYFDSEGKMLTGYQQIDGECYFFDETGAMIKGWYNDGTYTYYFGTDGKALHGWQILDGKKYYFNKAGIMFVQWRRLENIWYYFSTDGVLRTGWQKIDNSWYYLDPETGARYSSGVKQIDGEYYGFDANGVMQKGWFTEGKYKYYFSSSGAALHGWQTLSGKKYYFNKAGIMFVEWRTLNGKWYYFGTDGVLRTGWLLLNNNWYYLESDGSRVTSASKTIKGKTYNFDANGVCTNPY